MEEAEPDGKEGAIGDQQKFLSGLRVLAVDDDRACLKILEALLNKCSYQVTTTDAATTALAMLRERKDRADQFDLVITDVHMPEMDGFKLLEIVGLEMDIAVIMLSANDDPQNVLRGVNCGARDFLVKPVRIQELKIIWKHVIRKSRPNQVDSRSRTSSGDDKRSQEPLLAPLLPQQQPPRRSVDEACSRDRRRKGKENLDGGSSDTADGTAAAAAVVKKVRFIWAPDLHRKFADAVRQLSVDKAVPKKILELMNVPGLTRENVASHLQKYRASLKKERDNMTSHMVALGSSVGQNGSGYVDATSLESLKNYHAFGVRHGQRSQFQNHQPSLQYATGLLDWMKPAAPFSLVAAHGPLALPPLTGWLGSDICNQVKDDPGTNNHHLLGMQPAAASLACGNSSFLTGHCSSDQFAGLTGGSARPSCSSTDQPFNNGIDTTMQLAEHGGYNSLGAPDVLVHHPAGSVMPVNAVVPLISYSGSNLIGSSSNWAVDGLSWNQGLTANQLFASSILSSSQSSSNASNAVNPVPKQDSTLIQLAQCATHEHNDRDSSTNIPAAVVCDLQSGNNDSIFKELEDVIKMVKTPTSV